MKQSRKPKPEVTYRGSTYKVRSAKIKIPDLNSMNDFEALIWLNTNTYARGYSKPASPLAGFGGAITVN